VTKASFWLLKYKNILQQRKMELSDNNLTFLHLWLLKKLLAPFFGTRSIQGLTCVSSKEPRTYFSSILAVVLFYTDMQAHENLLHGEMVQFRVWFDFFLFAKQFIHFLYFQQCRQNTQEQNKILLIEPHVFLHNNKFQQGKSLSLGGNRKIVRTLHKCLLQSQS